MRDREDNRIGINRKMGSKANRERGGRWIEQERQMERKNVKEKSLLTVTVKNVR